MRHRALWAAALGLLTVLAAWRASRLEFDFSFNNFVLGEPPDDLTTAVTENFGNVGGSYLVAILRGDDVFRRDVLTAIQELSDELESVPHIDRVFGLATVPFIRGDRDALSVRPLSALLEEDVDPAGLKSAVLASPLYVRRLVSSDGRATAVLALLAKDHVGIAKRRPTIETFEETVRRHLPSGFTVLLTGYPIAEAEYARLVWHGFFRAEIAAVVLMALTLFACFRTIAGVTLPLVTVGIATVLTLGFMEVSGQHVTLTNATVPLMLLVIGVAEVSFFISRYYEEAARGGPHGEAVIRAAAGVIPPGLTAAATTSAGFFALGTGHIGLTRDLGLTMGVGMIVTVLVAVALVPGTFSLLGSPPVRALRAARGDLVGRVLRRIGRLDVERPRAVLGAALVVLGVGVLVGRHVTVAQYATRELREDHPVRIAQEVVDSQLTGAFITQIGIRARDGGPLNDPARLQKIEALERFVAAQPRVVKAWSIVDYVKELDLAARGGDGNRALSTAPDLLDQYLLLLSSGGRTSDVSTLIDRTNHLATIVFGTTDLGTSEMLALHERTQAFARQQLGDELDVRFVGDYWVISQGADSLVRDLAVGLVSSAALVFALVALFFRSWKLTVLSIPPNLLPLAAALGLMGLLAIPLRVGTSILLPVSLGIAIDSTIQYLARVRQEWRSHGDYERAVREALAGTGRAIVFSAAVLVTGFLCFFIPEFRVFHDVGLLASFTMFVALLANLFVTPCLVLVMRPLSAE